MPEMPDSRPCSAGEVAWVCETCAQGMLLDEDQGIKKIDVFFSAQIAAVTRAGGRLGYPWALSAR